MGVLKGCKPRKEVLKGDLDDASFAADFGDLIANEAPKVYGDVAAFFQNTHPARQLCKIIEVIFARLTDPKYAAGLSEPRCRVRLLGKEFDEALEDPRWLAKLE